MKIWNELLSLFYPDLCLLCRTPLTGGERHLCLRCLYRLPYTRYEQKPDNPAALLFAGKVPVSGASAFLLYEKESSVQHLIHSLKYKGNKELAYYLGRLAALNWKPGGLYETVDLLVPVPLHPRRQRSRGYNQAERIAAGIASVTGKPVDTVTLKRISRTETQTNKSVYDRWQNVDGIFELVSPERFAGKHILLVDDVLTTGATTGACARTVFQATGVRVSIFALAVAER